MKSSDLSFRKANSQDPDALTQLINSAYRGSSAKEGWTHEADLVDGLRTTPAELSAIIGNSGEFFLLAFLGNNLVGSVHIKDEKDRYYFGMLAVKPNLQNQKIGAGLMAEVERLARNEKKNFIRISVIHLRKELISYYERKGFVLTGENTPFPPQYPAKIPGLLLLEMRKTL